MPWACAAWLCAPSCTQHAGAGDDPAPPTSKHAPPVVAEAAHAPETTPPARAEALPLDAATWLEAPGRVLTIEGTTFVAVGEDLLVERDGVLMQDGLVANVPNCRDEAADVADIVDVAGTWPGDAWMVRATSAGDAGPFWAYRWTRDRWAKAQRIDAVRPLVTTSGGAAVLLVRSTAETGGYTLRRLGSPEHRKPAASEVVSCPSVLADPQRMHGNARGDLVVAGLGCDGEAVIESYTAGAARSQVTRWPEHTISAMELGATGRITVARTTAGGPKADILVLDGGAWATPATLEGTVRSIADLGDDGIILVLEGEQRTIEQVVPGRAGRELPSAFGAPTRVTRAGDGTVWIATDVALLRTRPAAYAWTLMPVGCDAATVRGAERYRYRDRRPSRWDCAGGMFVLVDTTRGEVPQEWQRLLAQMPEQVDMGLAEARRRRGLDGGRRRPGVPVEPVVAHELGDVHFGLALHGGADVTELALSDLGATMQRLGLSPPRALCAAPPGLPELQVRRLAEPHRVRHQ